jgi:hypothetical protein
LEINTWENKSHSFEAILHLLSREQLEFLLAPHLEAAIDHGHSFLQETLLLLEVVLIELEAFLLALLKILFQHSGQVLVRNSRRINYPRMTGIFGTMISISDGILIYFGISLEEGIKSAEVDADTMSFLSMLLLLRFQNDLISFAVV